MSKYLVFAAIAGICVASGLSLDHVPAWRQLLFPVLSAAAYLQGRHLPARHDWAVPALAALPGAVLLVPEPARGAGALMCLALFVVLPWLAGRFRRQQADLVLAGRERIAQLELIALRERARIAADMHDSLGHELALIALRAGALELAPDLSPPHREAAAALRASAVTATDRLRETIGILREPAPADPADERVEALVERAREAGMVITLRAGEGPRPPTVERAVHRVVQEALTNAARHAPGSAVTVGIEHRGHEIVVVVRNELGDTVAVPSGDGSGLSGLRERMRLLGGSLQAGPGDGGFTVTARIPVARP
ncbi:sensor histidine kinase [Dactylosporangium sp. CA-052675]|uniref:sensor histidine kinase n=1 Tax=Dactylosporangium sp. CA-052675 TaxID=3239927 RepID=UPI003D8DCD80